MKNNYISAINKVTASDQLREKTLTAMKQAQSRPASKSIKFNKKLTLIAACAVFALCIPAIAYVLDFNNMLGTKNAPPMMMAQQDTQPEMALNNEAEAMPKAAAFDAKTVELTEEQATAMILKGEGFFEGAINAGGYETESLVINLVTKDAETNAFKFEVTDKNSTKLVLYIY